MKNHLVDFNSVKRHQTLLRDPPISKTFFQKPNICKTYIDWFDL